MTSSTSRRAVFWSLARAISKGASLTDPGIGWASGSTGWGSMIPASIDAWMADTALDGPVSSGWLGDNLGDLRRVTTVPHAKLFWPEEHPRLLTVLLKEFWQAQINAGCRRPRGSPRLRPLYYFSNEGPTYPPGGRAVGFCPRSPAFKNWLPTVSPPSTIIA